MKKTTAIGIAILFIAALVPLLWFRQGYIISSGDEFPSFLNPQRSFNTGIYLWSSDYLGYATPNPAYALYQYSGIFLNNFGISVGSIQTFFQIFLFIFGAFSMYYFSKTVYPKLKLAAFVAGFFYMFNIFTLANRLDLTLIWTYAFLPLLLGLFVKIVNTSSERDNKTANKNIVYFALASVVALSVESPNTANLALNIFGLTILAIYYLIKFRRLLRPILVSFVKIAGLTIPINLWWLYTILNYYLFSPQSLNTSVNVVAWSWTHVRASFLNLFWLNGFWGWLPEYVPYINAYSNSILTVLVFVPFIIAASALFFKGEKSRFNAYILFSILILLFLAKGLHEPFGQLNLQIYQNIPFMNMFREPASRFTLLIVPFLALLIGYAAESIANIKIPRVHFRFNKILVVSLLLMTFAVAVYPLILNPLETKTQELPFSSYVQVPDYWYQASNWINSQHGDWKVLITPLDDFYQMPYTWGYYGSDSLTSELINKPIVSTANLNGYKINMDTASTLGQLNYAMLYNRPEKFKGLLDLLNVKFIMQRNDIEYNLTGRNIMSPAEMSAFLIQQPYIHLVQRFGQIDIYEYSDAKPFLYTISQSFQQPNFAIQGTSVLEKAWNFSLPGDIQAWQNSTTSNQWQSTYTIKQDADYLEAELWNSTYGWKTINSPLLPAQYGNAYQIQAEIKGENAYQVHVKITEYAANMSILNEALIANVNSGTFNWTQISFQFETTNPDTKFIQIQIWHGFKSPLNLPNILWIAKVKVFEIPLLIDKNDLDQLFVVSTENSSAIVLSYQIVNPTRIEAVINATHPFVLAVSESLDSSWVASFNGKQIKPISIYPGVNGFSINETGQFKVTIEYTPQHWFQYASIISVSATVTIVAFLLIITRDHIKGFIGNMISRKGAKY